MRPFRRVFLILLALVVVPSAVAQWAAPAVTLSAQPGWCPDSQPGFTCNTAVNVFWAIPESVLLSCTAGCHVEYCLVQPTSGPPPNPCGSWTNGTTTWTLDQGYGVNTVYAQYRTVPRGGRHV